MIFAVIPRSAYPRAVEPRRDVDIRGRLDEATLAALSRGDPSTIEAALRALHPEIRRRMHHLLGPRAELDDAVQDTLIELARALPRFEGRASLATLASRITVRTAFRYFGRSPTVSLDATPTLELVDDGDPESRVAVRETLRRLYRCLEKLSPKRRVAFVLCCVEGMQPAEAAEIEGIPSLVMRARLLEARNEVARLMKGDPLAMALLDKSPRSRDRIGGES